MVMTGSRGSFHPEDLEWSPNGFALATFAEVDWLIGHKADEQRCENPITVCSNFKRFFLLTRLKTLRIIFTVMVKQAEIGRFLEELGI